MHNPEQGNMTRRGETGLGEDKQDPEKGGDRQSESIDAVPGF
jgi:hypothetical protein